MSTNTRQRAVLFRIMMMILVVMTFFCFADIDTYAASTTTYAAATVSTASGQVNSGGGVYLRAKASKSSKKVARIKNNAKVTIVKEVFVKKNKSSAKYKWYYVKVSGKKGYIRSDLIDHVKYKNINGITTSALNYRVGPSTKMTRKGTFKEKAIITVVMKANVKGNSKVWYKVKKGNKYYYVCSDWVKLGIADIVTTMVTPSEPVVATDPEEIPDADPEFTVNDLTYPTEQIEGIPFTLKGTIDCTLTIQKARFGVVNSSGKWVIQKEVDVKAKKFNIATVDTAIKFGSLAPGKYTYKGVLIVYGKEYTQVSKAFTVTKAVGGDKLAATALQLAWPCGTAKSTYGSKPTDAYKAALDKVYPEHNSWGKGPNTGASCDVFIGTVCRYSGIDSAVPRTLGKQWTYFASNPDKWAKIPYSYKQSDLKSGDIFIYTPTSGSKHVCMYLEINGKAYCAEASYPRALYGFVNTSTSKFFTSSNKKKLEVYRPNI